MRMCAIGSALFLACLMAGASVGEQENTQGPSYVVVFEIRPAGPQSPTVRLNCVVAALTEGEATMKAYKYLCDIVHPVNNDRLVFLEAAKR
jgi:hypothetical protein